MRLPIRTISADRTSQSTTTRTESCKALRCAVGEGVQMARQPFLPTYKGRSYGIGARAIEQRPEFISLIGKCLTQATLQQLANVVVQTARQDERLNAIERRVDRLEQLPAGHP